MLDRSPLELLASFAICLVAGFVANMALDHWAKKIQKEAEKAAGHVCAQ